MHQVFTIGETLLDIIFREGRPVAAKPGGSMLNAAVSLRRAGIPVRFISDFGFDEPGELIANFLEMNGISAQDLHRYHDGKTALALAFLDEKQNASYTFYKQYPPVRLTGTFPAVEKDDILLFGSIYAITREIREKITGFVRRAAGAGAIILYDPNFRSAHLSELEEVMPFIRENLSLATIVRGSDEDFLNIFASGNGREAYLAMEKEAPAEARWLVYTRSRERVQVTGSMLDLQVPVPPVEPVSTIGAGDAFNAGLAWYLVRHRITREMLAGMREEEWRNLAGIAIRFAADVCMSYENYISEELIKEIEQC